MAATLSDVLILGAGVAGLAAAGALRRAGARVVVLDKGRGPGGRVATRRVDGQPVDHGLSFFHGSEPAFLAALDAVSATALEGWPARVRGAGAPCNPAAFDPYRPTRRLAFAEGVSAFPKRLSEGLDLRCGVRAARISADERGFTVTDEQGEACTARDLVLALPVEQSAQLLDGHRALAPARALLGTIGSAPCQTVIAVYDGPDEPLDFEILLPEESKILQLVSHDSSKRAAPRKRVLVLQARGAWSARHLEDPPERVSAALLAEAARLLGPWAGAPASAQQHRWRYARARGGDQLGAPLLLNLGGARLGVTGESFAPGGGVEGGFLAGQRLARTLTGEQDA